MKPMRLVTAVILLLIMGLCWWQVLRATDDIERRDLIWNGLPLRYIGPANPAGPLPGVVIAHGFSGAQQMMLGYSYTLAKAGYGTIILDFSGHGANPAPLNTDADVLQENLDAAYAALLTQPEIDPTRVAALGHSMGSGAVMLSALTYPERYAAVVAISPTAVDVTAEAPRNLYLQAGMLEGRFVANAERVLAAAGGPAPITPDGRGRAFEEIPYVEHITILYSPQSHRGVRNWLNGVFGEQPAVNPDYEDLRVWWYLLHLAAGLGLIVTLGPLAHHQPARSPATSRRWFWLWPLLAPWGGALLLTGIHWFTPVHTVGGILVGGGVALWHFLVGLLWLSRLTWRRPHGSDLGYGLLLFVLLTVSFGALGHLVWVPWWAIPERLIHLPFFFILLLPIMLAAALAQEGARPGGRWLWWFGLTVNLTVGLLLVVFLVPEMGFIILILPLLPVIWGITTIGNAALDGRPWAAALANALFVGWLLMVVFPIG